MFGLVIGLVSFVVAILGPTVASFKTVRRVDAAAGEALRDLCAQLDQRSDLVAKLLSALEPDAVYEVAGLEAVVASEPRGGDLGHDAVCDNRLSTALVEVNAEIDNDPELRADPDFEGLRRELADVEGRLGPARERYNDAVAVLNRAALSMPYVLFARSAREKRRPFYRMPDGRDPYELPHWTGTAPVGK